MTKDQVALIVSALEYSRPTHAHYPEPLERHDRALAAARAIEASLTGSAPAVAAEPVRIDGAKIEAAIDSYIEDYEMRGEDEDGRDACCTPNADDRALIKDAVMGLLADDDFLAAFGHPIP